MSDRSKDDSPKPADLVKTGKLPTGEHPPVITAEVGFTELRPGTRVGEYEIERQLGEGGMGLVYLAVHPLIGKKVAVKVLAPDLASHTESVFRFIQEARAVNQIGHRNIVDIFQFASSRTAVTTTSWSTSRVRACAT